MSTYDPTETYWLPIAKCVETGQIIKEQDLTGHRYTRNQKSWALAAAQRIAANQNARTEYTWHATVREYKPGTNRL